MPGAAQEFDDADLDGPLALLSRAEAREEDEHWSRAHRREAYYQPHLDYEDYAAAYCVGYIGYAQYGGTFEDAEKSLYANWVRIKGGSRLGPDQALPAIRAAWDRLARRAAEDQDEPVLATPRFHRSFEGASADLVAA
ncbi:MAG: hypothetical protein ABIU58_03565 [Ramlibacter sp.]